MNNIDLPLSEYPRPQLVRDSYLCLNGEWEYAITKSEEIPDEFQGTIIVPFSPECNKDINHILQPDEFLYYKKSFTLEKGFNKGRVLLHFVAVDQIAKVWINGKYLGEHIGGFLPFEFEITKYLKDENIIIVQVVDLTDTSYHARGKQKLDRGGIWYTPQSGIYMPVWIESVPKQYVQSLKITSDIDTSTVHIKVISDGVYPVTIYLKDKEYQGVSNETIDIKIDSPRLWRPKDPYLYEFKVKLNNDEISSYFGMRKISTYKDEKGIVRIALNNKPIFMSGVLDQGYYKDTLLTPPSDEAYIKDITLLKSLGFNCIRKHIKIESPRWYYHCDRIGMLVWQDFVNGGEKYKFSTISFPLIFKNHSKDSNYKKFSRENEMGRKYFIKDAIETVMYLYNSPSIVLWTIFNEGWGQFDSKKLMDIVRGYDKTRLIDHASGWHDQGISDVKSDHVYFKKYRLPKKSNERAIVLSEFGGYHLAIEKHVFSDKSFGYKGYEDKKELTNAIVRLFEKEILPNIKKGLCASIYTQLSDVEDEVNGFITFDREVVKVDDYRIKGANELLLSEIENI